MTSIGAFVGLALGDLLAWVIRTNTSIPATLPGSIVATALIASAVTGVAFGMFNGTAYANYAFTFVSLAALAFIIVLHRQGAFPGWMSRLAVALLVSGIFGNLTDRLFREHATGKLFNGTFFDGYVVDFLRFDFGFPPFNPWPSFNVADSCVVCAAILLALSTFLEKPEEQKI
jgi:signal peptidase II